MAKLGELGVVFTPDGFRLDLVEGELCEDAAQVQAAFERDRYRALYRLGFDQPPDWFAPSLRFLHGACASFLRALTRLPELELARGEARAVLEQDEAERLLRRRPFGLGAEHIDEAWLSALYARMNAVFAEEIEQWAGSVELYLTEKTQRLRVPERLFFHLVENRADESFPFAFMATYATRVFDAGKEAVRHMPLSYALTEFRGDRKKLLELLACLGRASSKSAFVSDLMESGELFSPLRLSAQEAYTFLREIPLYEESGIFCRVPNWHRNNAARVQLSVSVGEKSPGKLSLGALLDLRPRLVVDGVELSREEVADLLAQTEGLALIKGKWAEIDHGRLQSLLREYDRAQGGSMTLLEALRGGTGLEDEGAQEGLEAETTNGAWLRALRERMRNPALIEPPSLPPTFEAKLRHYQMRGFAWLDYLCAWGFGACLADDMGLGKTVQVLAFLERMRTQEQGRRASGEGRPASLADERPQGRVLLVVPASLLGNWRQELARFAPQMPCQLLHGKTGTVLEEEFDPGAFLTLTTYALASKLACVQKRSWDLVVLDEAQAIKNPASKQTRAIKAIEASMRVAMTGTPIENDLSNLWSLFDFLNRGLLGTRKEFGAFAKRLGADPEGYARLRAMVGPFILRRLKTDKAIAPDLPEKNEIDLSVSLSKKQVVLYRKVTSELERSLEGAEGIARRGLVLATVMRLKQICNHPSQYLGDPAFAKQDSGKFALLEDVCATIYEKRERVLVFTQFREMCGPLHGFLSQVFGREGLVVHGGVNPKKRTQLVARFQDEERYLPFMVLSLKAGGTGLNLTAANHVVHFDRWWNPAVENQATDRAFRIGQGRDVMVYKMTSRDTVEERIAQMLADKSKLADDVIGESGEGWIAKLDDADLMNLLRLG